MTAYLSVRYSTYIAPNHAIRHAKSYVLRWYYHTALAPHVDLSQFCNQRSKLSSPVSQFLPIYFTTFHFEAQFNNWALKLKAGAGLIFNNMNNVIILKKKKKKEKKMPLTQTARLNYIFTRASGHRKSQWAISNHLY